ncbi:PREDICTED: poly [ADP-ribose] polymerase 12-like [Acropora digitifera]|uniref:poly [ADP-ribose] polymerase 12-like n=1 Tax=Acropora digitifera TaxID=70779 RepID=UPI00077A1B28|nr:PREDICTED: poly [ADP-ribose] polymerase 12-like [Acropora digitifera]
MLEKLCLEKYSNKSLRKIIAWSLPQVCQLYLRGQCNSNKCSYIHVCHREIQGLSCGCSLSHSLFRERRNLAVLSQYDIVPTNLTFACCSVLHLGEDPCSVYQNSSSHRASFVEGKTAISGPSAIGFGVQTLNWNTPTMIAAKGFIHVDKPEAPICLSFLVGTCKLGKRCSNHHCSLPYHWQYKVPINDVWNSFSDEDNVALERLYCDVNNTQMEFKPVETLDFSLTERVFASLVKGFTITIDLDYMLILLKPLKSRQFAIRGQLRRLCAVGDNVDPSYRMPMSWSWYWEENGEVWRSYDKDYSERELQGLIEKAYVDYLKQGKVKEEFKFETAKHKYKLVFSSIGMYQVNLETGTRRRVRRRPGKVISNEDMEDLKWMYGDSSHHEDLHRLLRAEKKHIPSHWCPMPPNLKYYRAWVDPSSVEFKDLEKLFKSTMNDEVLIAKIERVQNLFMMEKYCR